MSAGEEVAAAYDRVAPLLVEQWKDRNAIYHDRLIFFASLLPPGARILDVGCGFGRDVHFFASRGFAAEGIDASRNMLSSATALYGKLPLVLGDLFSMGSLFVGRRFDAFWIRGVLFHCPLDRIASLAAQLRELAGPGTLLYVQVTRDSGGGGRSMVRSLSHTDENLLYHLHNRADLEAAFTRHFSMVHDISTAHDICLIFRANPDQS